MDDELPGGASIVEEEYPDLWRAYAGLGAACAAAGPLDAKTQRPFAATAAASVRAVYVFRVGVDERERLAPVAHDRLGRS